MDWRRLISIGVGTLIFSWLILTITVILKIGGFSKFLIAVLAVGGVLAFSLLLYVHTHRKNYLAAFIANFIMFLILGVSH